MKTCETWNSHCQTPRRSLSLCRA